MKITLEKTYIIDAPVEHSWMFLQDIKGVAECMPGAQITEQIDASHFKGLVNVKLGPAKVSFKGDIEIVSIHTEQRELHLLGKGTDVKGSSSSTMNLTAQVRDHANGKSELVCFSEITVTGKIASFGGRLMTQVSDQILKQFSAQFNNRVMAMNEAVTVEHTEKNLPPQARPKNAMNGLALMWNVFVAVVKNFFSAKAEK